MTQVYGAEKIRRTCAVRGRESEGRFGLVRKNVATSKVIPPHGDGSEQEIETSLVYDERIQPKPPKQTNRQVGETKIHPADKPQRRLCIVEGRGETKFHLLRKGADGSKILEVGVEGQGEWIPTAQIAEEFFVPIPTRARYVERKPVKICKLDTEGDQEYLVLRTTNKGARLVPVYEANYGITVDPARLVDVKTINAKKKKKGEQPVEGEQITDGTSGGVIEEQHVPAAQPVAAQVPVQHAPQTAPPVPHAPAPVQHAPQQQHAPAPQQQHAPAPQQQHAPAPAQHAPQPAGQPQARPAQPQPPRPGQAPQPGGQPRPAPVGVAPRPAQPGRPVPQQAR